MTITATLSQVSVPYWALALAGLAILVPLELGRRRRRRSHPGPSSVAVALRESEERFRKAFDHAPIGMAMVAVDGRFLKVNRALCDIVGYQAEELLTRDFQSITHPDDLTPDLAYAGRLLSGELTTYQMDKRYLHKNGQVVWVQLNGSVVRSIEDEPLLFIAQIQDITERRRALAELRTHRALLQQVFEALPVGVWIMDEKGTINYGNRAAQQIWAGARYVGPERFGEYKAWWTETGEPIQPDEWAGARAIVKGETSIGELIDIQCFDGSRKTILNSAIPLRNGDDGGMRGAIIVNEDITARRQLEAQLRQAQKMEAVGRLAGGIAHDFNNLLSVIRQSAELVLEEHEADSDEREDMEAIIGAADRAGQLTNQLLAFSRRQPLAALQLDVNVVLQSLNRLLGRLMPKSVQMRLELASEPALVFADPVQLEQVLLNLAVNARDAMPQGGTLELAVRSTRVAQRLSHRNGTVAPGNYVTIRVRDTGIGMEPEVLERIFEPFYTTKGTRGTGLGLPTAFGIVQQSGGHLIVESVPGVSTTFIVYLPQLTPNGDLPGIAASPPVPQGGTETLLLVDDDHGVRRATRRLLERQGYTVLEAGGGIEALDLYRRNAERIALLVTDMVMPGMSGRELVERIRPLRPDLQVLYISGYTDDDLVRQGLLGPHERFLRKPFAGADLARAIRLHLEHR
jgi:PAS domain S-box-containing protein